MHKGHSQNQVLNLFKWLLHIFARYLLLHFIHKECVCAEALYLLLLIMFSAGLVLLESCTYCDDGEVGGGKDAGTGFLQHLATIASFMKPLYFVKERREREWRLF